MRDSQFRELQLSGDSNRMPLLLAISACRPSLVPIKLTDRLLLLFCKCRDGVIARLLLA